MGNRPCRGHHGAGGRACARGGASDADRRHRRTGARRAASDRPGHHNGRHADTVVRSHTKARKRPFANHPRDVCEPPDHPRRGPAPGAQPAGIAARTRAHHASAAGGGRGNTPGAGQRTFSGTTGPGRRQSRTSRCQRKQTLARTGAVKTTCGAARHRRATAGHGSGNRRCGRQGPLRCPGGAPVRAPG